MSEPPRKQASYKRIILCADGTWLASNTGDGSVPSNVAKIARAIANNGLDEKGNLVKQVVYYHSGLGSTDLPGQKAVYGKFTCYSPNFFVVGCANMLLHVRWSRHRP